MPSTVVPPPPAWARTHLATSGAAARARLATRESAGPARRGVRAAVVAAVVLTITAVAAGCLLAVGSVGAGAPAGIPARVLAQPVQAGPGGRGGPAPRPAPNGAPANGAAQQAGGRPPADGADHIGGWTPQLGRAVARRALRWLGWPYSFAGGNALGPTYGVAVDAASRNDPQVDGFDCSGLVLYALAPWRTLSHLASAQYVEAGTWHPALSTLQPGDLVFWSTDGTIAGVTHVAIYLGNGAVIQAPHSGARITVTPLDEIEPGSTIGTVRPLT